MIKTTAIAFSRSITSYNTLSKKKDDVTEFLKPFIDFIKKNPNDEIYGEFGKTFLKELADYTKQLDSAEEILYDLASCMDAISSKKLGITDPDKYKMYEERLLKNLPSFDLLINRYNAFAMETQKKLDKLYYDYKVKQKAAASMAEKEAKQKAAEAIVEKEVKQVAKDENKTGKTKAKKETTKTNKDDLDTKFQNAEKLVNEKNPAVANLSKDFKNAIATIKKIASGEIQLSEADKKRIEGIITRSIAKLNSMTK